MTATTTLQPLTPRQRAIYRFIRDYRRKNRVSPSLREIQEKFGISINGVVCHVEPLVRKGWLERFKNNASRSLLPTKAALENEYDE